MYQVSITLKDNFFINEKVLFGEMKIERGKVSLIHGENGIGKSTLLHFLKKKQAVLFPNKRCSFTDQYRYTPLNDISFDESLASLRKFRFEELSFYNEHKQIINDFSTRPINSLSGGQNQMIKIFTSLYLSGDIFFLDEPLQYLDKKNINFVLELIKYLKSRNIAVCIVEHQKNLLTSIIDNCYEISCQEGKILLGETSGF